MKQISKGMSDLLLSGIVCAMLLGILAGMALLSRLGEQMKTEKENYSEYQDIAQTKWICARKPPELVRKGASIWKTGEKVRINQAFEAVDEEGNHLDVQVLDIQDAFGISRMEWYDKAGHTAVFLRRGAYVLELRTADGQKKPTVKKFMLLIDDR
ncbi:hypothetical protein E5329_17590 [Petralouisia muris]|jgi:hypothetical protein|uniref:Uncharacterized protein n=1 Tax=Petralouisia muris TaxID=3032872 RepID=A0AC61RTR4_9FIRM|nr:hypothetical protein [Petralouisia muris]TGY93653.1 hypothetical protein E5329_17590 [Petralouisia muris]